MLFSLATENNRPQGGVFSVSHVKKINAKQYNVNQIYHFYYFYEHCYLTDSLFYGMLLFDLHISIGSSLAIMAII